MTILGLNPSKFSIGGSDERYKLNDTQPASAQATPNINTTFTALKNLFSFFIIFFLVDSLNDVSKSVLLILTILFN